MADRAKLRCRIGWHALRSSLVPPEAITSLLDRARRSGWQCSEWSVQQCRYCDHVRLSIGRLVWDGESGDAQ